MEIIVHYPDSKEAQDELKKAVAMIHVDFVANLFHNLTCPEEQKQAFLKSVIDEYPSHSTDPP